MEKKPCEFLREFLKTHQELLNMTTFEKIAQLPKTKMSHFMTGARDLTTPEVQKVMYAIEDFITEYRKTEKQINKAEK